MTQNTQQTQAVQIAQENDAHLVALEKITGNDGFTRAITIANKAAAMRAHLTKEVMAGIMQLQGKAYGFRTDKVYGEDVVADCTIEAQIAGVLPVGNQMNILAGRMYITKEGFKYLLDKIDGLRWMITPQIPKMTTQGAECVAHIEWKLNGELQTKDIAFAIRVNANMGADAVCGKCKRKAEAWLYNQITGMDLADGDTSDVDAPQTRGRFSPIDVTPKEEEARDDTPANFREAGLTAEQVEAMYDYYKWPKDGMAKVNPAALKEAWARYTAEVAR